MLRYAICCVFSGERSTADSHTSIEYDKWSPIATYLKLQQEYSLIGGMRNTAPSESSSNQQLKAGVDHVLDKRLKKGTKRGYTSKIKIMSAWLRTEYEGGEDFF